LKKLSIVFLLTAFVSASAALAVAQDNGGNGSQSAPAGESPEHGDGHHHFDPAKRTEILTKQLKLTTDQQAKVLDTLKSEQAQMEKLRSDSSLAPEDRRAKMMDIRKSSNDQIRGFLDPDQQKKWDKMQNEREQWHGHHHEGQDSAATPDSSQ
jgi:periplasmic protein CpxP/Spy